MDKDTNSLSARIEICKNCKELTKLKFCSICKCFMPAKVRFKSSFCPAGKWFRIAPDQSNENK